MMLRFILLCISLSLCNCNGVIMNHYASRAHQPLDGTNGNSRFNSEDVSYAIGNLEYLNDREARNNNLYFASARKYNQIKYQIAHDYILNYQKFVKVDAKELEHRFADEQKHTSRQKLLKQMESGTLPVRPLQGNIEAMQNLKDEKNKIAFPDYMDEYLTPYNQQNDTIIQKQTTQENQNDEHFIAFAITDRDSYVQHYLYDINNDGQYKATQVFQETQLS